MKFTYYFAILILSTLLTGCKSYYQGAFTGSEFNKIPIPTYKEGETKGKHYVSGGLGEGIKYYQNEQNTFKFISYNYGKAAKNFNIGVGGKLFLGDYNVKSFKDDLLDLNKKYNYWGFQAQCMFGFNIPISEKFHWRVANWQMSWHIERGDFYNFRDNIIQLDNNMERALGFFDDFTNFSAHGYTEFIFIPAERFSLGLLGGLGTSVKHMNIATMIGASIEFDHIGIQATRTFSTPNLASSFIAAFEGNTKTGNAPWQIGLYYKF